MLDPRLRKALLKLLKPTRRLVLQPGDPGQLPVTKVGGVPWWPRDTARPRCPDGHAMSFIAQFRLDDVPGLGTEEPTLLVFHYCQECTLSGHGGHGWHPRDCSWANPDDSTRYDLSMFRDFVHRSQDGLEVVGAEVEGPHTVTYSDRLETLGVSDILDMPRISEMLRAASSDDVEGMLAGAYRFDESKFPDLVHIPDWKLGGWPSWVHSAEWPRDYPDEELIFIAQLSPLTTNEFWCNGLAYLFVNPASYKDRKAKLLLQYT